MGRIIPYYGEQKNMFQTTTFSTFSVCMPARGLERGTLCPIHSPLWDITLQALVSAAARAEQ